MKVPHFWLFLQKWKHWQLWAQISVGQGLGGAEWGLPLQEGPGLSSWPVSSIPEGSLSPVTPVLPVNCLPEASGI